MKKLIKTFLSVFLLFLMLFGTAHAIPLVGDQSNNNVLPNTPGFSWDDTAYWTPTDLTTNAQGESLFQLEVELAAYESDFGLFAVDDINNPTSITQFEIFDYTEEPLLKKSVFFKDTGSGWQASLNPNSGFTNFDIVFGFYYGVHTDPDSSTVDYTYFSDSSLNTVDVGDQHVAVEWDGTNEIYIYLEDLRTANADWDWQDMTVYGNDLRPVPEPTTMIISSLFLLGAGFYVRRKLHRKA